MKEYEEVDYSDAGRSDDRRIDCQRGAGDAGQFSDAGVPDRAERHSGSGSTLGGRGDECFERSHDSGRYYDPGRGHGSADNDRTE